jgi:Vault protein inter-alpha-trypsin domain
MCMMGKFLIAQGAAPSITAEGEANEMKAMVLSKLAIDVNILGSIAETRMSMTFYNPHDRNLAGELDFPLPEGAFVSGYALDINGVMVDGVVVEKEKGRVVFEKLSRQRIDPGLVEWSKGNNFKTRIFPLPAQGTRTIMVRYISELSYIKGKTFYHLPLKYNETIKEFSLRIEAIGNGIEPPVSRSAIADMQFEKLQGRMDCGGIEGRRATQ